MPKAFPVTTLTTRDTFAVPIAPSPSQFLEYWMTFRRSLRLVTVLVLVGGAIGFALTMLLPRLYRSRTILEVRSLDENMLKMKEGAAVSNAESVLPESYLQTEIKILQSDSLLKRAMEAISKQDPLAKTDEKQEPWLGLIPAPKMLSIAELTADAASRVKVRALGQTRIVEISCDGRDAQVAANMCNSLAQTYIAHNLESRFEAAQETGKWLSSQLDNVRRRLTQAESDLTASARESALGLNSDTDNPAQEKLRQLQAELSRAQSDRISKQSEFETLSSAQPDSLPVTWDQGPIREYRMRLADLKRQRAELSATMTPQHLRVRELDAQITEVALTLQKERSDLLNRIQTDYRTARHRESMLATAFDQQTALVTQHGDKAVRYTMIKHDVDTQRRLYEALLQKVEEVGLATAMRASTITVVDPATPSRQPYSPNSVLLAGVGSLAGFGLAMGIALFRSRFDQTLRGPGEVADALRLRELGVIPSTPTSAVTVLLEQARSQPQFKMLPGASAPGRKELIRHRTEGFVLSEAFSGTMNSLILSSGGEVPKVLVVSSPGSGEGKTTVAVNLAIALANIGRRVVLVDGDMRSPRLHRIFNIPQAGGLSDLLDGFDALDKLSALSLARTTEVRNLFVVPAEQVVGDISSRLHSERMSQLLRQLQQTFDSVIIDSPPLLYLSDARVLGWLAGGMLLVFRAGKTTKEAAYAAQQILREDGIHVIGTVLNDWKGWRAAQYGSYSPAERYPRRQPA